MKPFSSSLSFLLLGLFSAEVIASIPSRTPEQEALFLGKNLRPITDEKWSTIAGQKLTETYKVVEGDTLFDISNRLFGDSKYWPKIWALNGVRITNPHRLNPGLLIAFSSGTGSSLPELNGTDPSNPVSASDAPTPHFPGKRSTEWQELPKQSWESQAIQLPPNVDPLGFDMHNKTFNRPPSGFDSQAIPASHELKFLGQIFGARSESEYLGMNDLIYIRPEQGIEFEIGKSYAISRDPAKLKSVKSNRVGYSYLILGKVEILGTRDSIYIGRVQSVRGFASRGDFLIPLPPRVKDLTAIPGAEPKTGIIMMDHNFSTFMTAQHKEVFIDKGTEDGIQPGMVFRAFQHFDPSNNKKVSQINFIIDADLMITQVSETFSTAMVIHSYSPILENSSAILLTDLSDLYKNDGFSKILGKQIEDLDKLDNGEGLKDSEKKELKQLEDWKKNPETSPSPLPSDVPPLEPTVLSPETSETPAPSASGAPIPEASTAPTTSIAPTVDPFGSPIITPAPATTPEAAPSPGAPTATAPATNPPADSSPGNIPLITPANGISPAPPLTPAPPIAVDAAQTPPLPVDAPPLVPAVPPAPDAPAAAAPIPDAGINPPTSSAADSAVPPPLPAPAAAAPPTPATGAPAAPPADPLAPPPPAAAETTITPAAPSAAAAPPAPPIEAIPAPPAPPPVAAEDAPPPPSIDELPPPGI